MPHTTFKENNSGMSNFTFSFQRYAQLTPGIKKLSAFFKATYLQGNAFYQLRLPAGRKMGTGLY